MGRRRSAKRRAGSARKKREARERKTGTGNKGGKSDTGKRGGDRPPSSGAEWLKAGVLAFFLFFILRLFILQTFVITSGSMEGTLLVGDFLVVNRAAIGSRVPFTDIRIPGYSEPRRGDVLVFDPHHEEDMTLVKRLVGIPGDTLEMRDKVLYLNGEAQDEPYVVTTRALDAPDPTMLWQREHLVGGPRDDYRPSRDNWGPIAIPPGYFFMLGDNRDSSLDSRYWGLLEGRRFEGRAVAIYFSYNRGSARPFPWIREIRGSRIGDRIR
ncbi:MAG: signal peptidase I [Gemmatimonadetes bacterium]|nr:signal peptidase I [Gemmatimonadota bacterium]MYH54517.1 signal peptidase I [Gemmatimonadota bacterium]MYK67962.1 signal peptidase I [Gemmatimonadota bacterium]